MQRILLKEATSGMVLAQAAIHQDGQILADAGSKLTSAIIDRIHNAGIGSVCVEDLSLEAGDLTSDRDVIIKNLDFLFRRHSQNTFMMTLRNMLAQYFTRKAANHQADSFCSKQQKGPPTHAGGE